MVLLCGQRRRRTSSLLIVAAPPLFNDHPSLHQAREDLCIETLLAEGPVEALVTAILLLSALSAIGHTGYRPSIVPTEPI